MSLGKTDPSMSKCVLLLMVVLCLSSGLHPASATPTGVKCPDASSTCMCKTSAGTVDLTKASASDGSPRYTGLLDDNNFAYDFNPCKAFTTQGECDNVHVCQKTTYEPIMTYDIADGGTEQMWIDDNGQVYLYYIGPELRETFVRLTCNMDITEPRITTEGDYGHYYTYEFTFESCHACPGGCDGSAGGGGGGGGGVSAGIAGILLMLFLVIGIATYFVVGAVIMKYRFQKTGTDIIPNKIFWFAVPGLIKAGCIFTFTPLVNLIRGQRGGQQYQQL